MRRHEWLHEAVAAAVRRRHPSLTVRSDRPAGNPTGWLLELEGGTEAERAKAMDFARRFAEGYVHMPDRVR